MEVVEESANLDRSRGRNQIFLSYEKNADSMSIGGNFVETTNEDLLALFGYSEESLKYYVSLKNAVVESREKGDISLCDPRDMDMRDRISAAGWKSRVVLKIFSGQGDSKSNGVVFSSKQVALDEHRQPEVDEDAAEDATRWQIAATAADDDMRKRSACHESFVCGIGGCLQTFASLASYESHYHSYHNFVCATCRSSFVSAFLLDVHLEESHDSYFQVLSPRTDMYRCLVESCKLKFRTPDLRKDHLITVHQLPANFMFHKPTGRKPSKTKGRQMPKSSSLDHTERSMDTSTLEPSPSGVSDETDEQTGPCVSLDAASDQTSKRVPRTISFGRGSRKGFSSQRARGTGRHWHQAAAEDMDTTVDLEKVDFTDMVDSLECG